MRRWMSPRPAVSEASTGVSPIAGGIPLSALPSAVRDLARFFLILSGSSSLGVVGGVAGMAASTAGFGFSCALSTSAAGAVALGVATAIPAGAGDPPATRCCAWRVWASAASGDSRSRRRRRCSSSGGNDGRSKKRHRRRSPSSVPSSRRREKHYRSSLAFRGYGSGFLPPTSGRSFFGGTSA